MPTVAVLRLAGNTIGLFTVDVEKVFLSQILPMNEVVPTILEILKYTIPSGIVFATAYYLLSKFLEEQRNIEMLRAKASASTTASDSSGIITLRLQAYERLILLLERIEPSQMVPRLHKPGVSGAIFAQELKQTVRSEYEHNLTQQIYVSEQAWDKVMESRNAVNQLIDLAQTNAGEKASGVQFSSVLFEILAKAGVSPTADGIETLRNEARQLL